MATAADLTPKISIIVPVYNVEPYLRRCLDSIVVQTFTDWECILIDDGSSDNSGVICDEYASRDARFHVFHQENKGVSAARNAGLDAARGEWIGFVDSDDWIESDMYSLLLEKGNETTDIVICNIFHEYRNKSLSSDYALDFSNQIQNIKNLLLGRISGYLGHKVFRRKLIGEIRFNSSLIMCEDLLFCVEVFLSTQKICFVDKPLCHYYLSNSQSATHTFWFSDRKINSLLLVGKYLESLLESAGLKDCCGEEFSIFLADKKAWYLLNSDFSCLKKYLHENDQINNLLCANTNFSGCKRFILREFSKGYTYIPWTINFLCKTAYFGLKKMRSLLCS